MAMKITTGQLRRIIREEVSRVLTEGAVNHRDVSNFIADYGDEAGAIEGASRAEIRGWFEGNGLTPPDDVDEFRAAVLAVIENPDTYR